MKRVAQQAPDLVESIRRGAISPKEAEKVIQHRQRDEEAARALHAQIEEDVEAVLDHLAGVDQSPRLRLIVTNSARYQATLNGFTNDWVYPRHLQESRAQAAAMLTEFRDQHYAEVQRNLEAANAARQQREAHEHLVLALSAAQEWLNCKQPFNPGHMTHHIHQPDDIIAILAKVITSIKNAPITEGENNAA